MTRKKVKKSAGLSNPHTRVSLSITPNSKSTLDKIASEIGLSKSAFFEGILDGSISLSSQTAQKSIALSEDNNSHSPAVSINQAKQNTSSDAIKQEIAREREKIASLEQQVKEKNKVEQSLQGKLQEQQAQIEQLQNKLNSQTKTTSQSTSADWQEELANKEEQIKQLNQRLSQQQQRIKQLQQQPSQTTPVVMPTPKHEDLATINQQQETINRLRARISELETVSSIGHQVLNKWRSKTFR